MERRQRGAFLFYGAYALPVVAVLLLARRDYWRDVAVRSAVGAAVVVAALYAAIILWHPVLTRVQDLAAVYALLGAWVGVALVRAGPLWPGAFGWTSRVLLRGSGAVVLAGALLSIDAVSNVREELRVAALWESPGRLSERAQAIIAAGREWPWRRYWPNGSPPDAVEYLYACTRPDERIWLTWQAPEFYVFARRGFGGGHAMTMAPHSYTSPHDQRLMIAHLEERVPLVLINQTTRGEFAEAYPLVDEGPQAWPCLLVPEASAPIGATQ